MGRQDPGIDRGATVVLEYYLWRSGELQTKTAHLFNGDRAYYRAGSRPRSGSCISGYRVRNLSDWDPPFPIDLDKVRKQDEDYWHQYKTTPKAFIPLTAGQELWQSRFGGLTSIRFSNPAGQFGLRSVDDFAAGLRVKLTASQMGLQVIPVRAEGMQASRGATDFGEYFLYFSFFLVVSALLLTALFFKLGIEQRLREIGTLQAIGFPAFLIRKHFLIEGVALAIGGVCWVWAAHSRTAH